jgi:hypothetical protein
MNRESASSVFQEAWEKSAAQVRLHRLYAVEYITIHASAHSRQFFDPSMSLSLT